MVTMLTRMKWRLFHCARRPPPELWGLLFIALLAAGAVSFLLQAHQVYDGSRIDLSPARQRQLIEDYRRERALRQSLEQREKENKQARAGSDNEIPGDARVGDNRAHHVADLDDKRNVVGRSNNGGDNRGVNGVEEEDDYRAPGGRGEQGDGDGGDEGRHYYYDDDNGDDEANDIGDNKDADQWLGKNKDKMVAIFDPREGKMDYKAAIADSALHGGFAHCRPYDVTEYINEDYDCTTLRIKPVTPICLYPDDQDVHISRIIRLDGLWEPHIFKEFQNILYGDPDLAVIDIGANIGVYSIPAAVMGHKVLAVEPVLENLKHLHQAVRIANVSDKLTAIQNGVSDQREIMFMRLRRDNQGGAHMELDNPAPDCVEEDCLPPKVWSVLMDDLLEVVNFKKAVMKVDIEGHEHRAFMQASRLLDQVYVPYIFMEWLKLRGYYGSEITVTEDKDLTHRLVRYLTARGYTPHGAILMDKLNPGFWFAWPDDIVWRHELAEYA